MPDLKHPISRRPREHSIVEKVFRASLTAYMMNMLAWALGTLVDGIFVGNFLGVDAVAAYGMIWPLTLLFGLIGGILSGGARTLYAKLAGHGKMDEANRVFTLACAAAFVLSCGMIVLIYAFHAPLAALLGAKGGNAQLRPLIGSYLMAFVLGLPFDSTAKVLSSFMGMDSDHARTVSATVTLTVADVIGDAAAIFVFHGGMFALGLATAVAQLLYCLVLLGHFRREKRMLRFVFRGLRGELGKLRDVFVCGAPAGTTRIAGAVGGILINRIIAAAATSSFIAAYSVHKSMASLVSATYFGIADTVWTLSSIYYGEEDRHALDALQRTALRIGAVITGVAVLLLLLFSRAFAALYLGRESEEALLLGAQAVRLFALSVPLYMLVYLFQDYLMGVNRLKAASFFGLLPACGAAVPTVWVMVKLMGGRGAWFATPVCLSLLIVAAYFYIIRWKDGEGFHGKRLLVTDDFGAASGKELSISADTMTEVIGMSRLAGLFCEENGIDKRRAQHLALCIEELGGNIIRHGFNDGKPHSIDIRILVKDEELILRVRDDCRPFNPLERYELTQQQKEDPAKNIGIRLVVGSCRDIQYLSTMSTNNLIIKL